MSAERLTPEAKRLANLRARCALQGVQLFVTADDRERPSYISTKWAMTFQTSSLDELAEWVNRIDGRQE